MVRSAAVLYTVTMAASGPVPKIVLKHGACRGRDPALFFTEADLGSGADEARRICGRCPVRRACLDYALPISGLAGVWGGMSAQQRTYERRKRGYVDGFHAPKSQPVRVTPTRRAQPVQPQVGCPSEAQYRRHRRNGEDCPKCRALVSAANSERRRRRGGR